VREYQSPEIFEGEGNLMPGVGGMALNEPQQPEPFIELDRFINNPGAAASGFHQSLRRVHGAGGRMPANPDYGPFANDGDMKAHWVGHWTNAQGRGGSYWPYLDQLDIQAMLTEKLTQSVGIALGPPRKTHRTVWTITREPPPTPVSPADQAQIFTVDVALVNDDTTVEVQIKTPRPLL
jgi:hypothetical protein